MYMKNLLVNIEAIGCGLLMIALSPVLILIAIFVTVFHLQDE